MITWNGLKHEESGDIIPMRPVEGKEEEVNEGTGIEIINHSPVF